MSRAYLTPKPKRWKERRAYKRNFNGPVSYPAIPTSYPYVRKESIMKPAEYYKTSDMFDILNKHYKEAFEVFGNDQDPNIEHYLSQYRSKIKSWRPNSSDKTYCSFCDVVGYAKYTQAKLSFFCLENTSKLPKHKKEITEHMNIRNFTFVEYVVVKDNKLEPYFSYVSYFCSESCLNLYILKNMA